MQTTIAAVLREKGNDIWWVPPEGCVSEAIDTMTQKRIEAVLVMSGDELVGILSERDCSRALLQGRDHPDVCVSEIMSTPVVFVSPQHTVGDCMWIMTAKRITHLPVVDGGRVVGVVSVGDLMRSIVETQGETIGHLEAYISGTYPA